MCKDCVSYRFQSFFCFFFINKGGFVDYKLYLGFIDLKGNLKDQGALWVFLYRCLNIKDVVNGISGIYIGI